MKPCVLAGLLMATSVATLNAQESASRSYTFALDVGVSGADLRDPAEAFGLRAIPGGQYGVVIAAVSDTGDAWSIHVFNERYRVNSPGNESSFKYSSISTAVRRSVESRSGGVPLRYAVEAGWRHYRAESKVANHYTGAIESTELGSGAAFLAVSYGVNIPSGATALTPHLRIETSYPGLGGGNGYSRLHSESDFDFRASVGVEIQLFSIGARR